jgi:hypothetical protein
MTEARNRGPSAVSIRLMSPTILAPGAAAVSPDPPGPAPDQRTDCHSQLTPSCDLCRHQTSRPHQPAPLHHPRRYRDASAPRAPGDSHRFGPSQRAPPVSPRSTRPDGTRRPARPLVETRPGSLQQSTHHRHRKPLPLRVDKLITLAHRCSFSKKAAAFFGNTFSCSSSRMRRSISVTRARSVSSRARSVCPGFFLFSAFTQLRTVSGTSPNSRATRHSRDRCPARVGQLRLRPTQAHGRVSSLPRAHPRLGTCITADTGVPGAGRRMPPRAESTIPRAQPHVSF